MLRAPLNYGGGLGKYSRQAAPIQRPVAPPPTQSPTQAPPIAMDRGFVPPQVTTNQSPLVQATSSEWNKAYDPTLGKAKSKAAMGGIGYDPTGYMKAQRELEAELNRRYGTRENVFSENDGVQVAGVREIGSPVKYNPYTGQLEYVQDPGAEFRYLTKQARDKAESKLSPKERERREAEKAAGLTEYTGKISADPQLQAQLDSVNALREQYQQKFMPEALTRQIQGMMDSGLDFAKTGMVGSNEEALFRLSSTLAEKGISDLNQIGVAQNEKGKPVYFNKATGQELGRGVINFKGGSGDGNLDVFLKHDPKTGRVYFTTDFESPEKTGEMWMDQLAPALILGMAAGPAGAAMGAGMGGGAAAMAAGNAAAYGTAGAANAAMQGGDVGKGFLTGAVGGGLGSLGTAAGQANIGQSVLGQGASPWAVNAINSGVRGAVSGGLQAGLSGGNVLQGALTSGLGSGISGGLGAYGSSLTEGQNPFVQGLGKVGTGALSGGLQSLLRGGDFSQGLQSGAVGGLGSAVSSGLGRYGQQAGLDPKMAQALGKFGGSLLTSGLRRG